jgi:hypothetical protein
MKLFDEVLLGEHIPIKSITAYYNPTLTSTFVNAWNINNERMVGSPNLFNSKSFKSFVEEREWILSEYDRKVNYYDWNSTLHLPIVACMENFADFFRFYFSIQQVVMALINTLVRRSLKPDLSLSQVQTAAISAKEFIVSLLFILMTSFRLSDNFSYFLCCLYYSVFFEEEKSGNYHFMDVWRQCVSSSGKPRFGEFSIRQIFDERLRIALRDYE